MKIPFTLFPGKTLIVLISLVFSAQAQASLLVYEGFDYALGNGTSMAGQANTATGLSGNYSAISGEGTQAVNYSTTGLTFGSNFLPTTGGASFMSSAGTLPGSRTFINIALAAGVSGYQGTLYSSYLVNFTSLSTATNVNVPDAGVSIWLDNGTSTNRLQSWAHTTIGAGDERPGVGYGASTNFVRSGTAGSLVTGTTYLVLSRFTNVGNAGGGTGDQFVFTLSAYNNWFSAGAVEAQLGTYATFSTTVSSSDQVNLSRLFLATYGRGQTESLTFDEFRMASSLDNVVAIPEPSSGVLLLISLGAFLMRCRRLS